jgi:hypothetical protein
MEFRTPVNIQKFPFSISHQTPTLGIGSCFVENIGQKLESSKFSIFSNPFGIVYNPSSIVETLAYLSGNQGFDEKNIFQQGEFWHSFSHHGSFSKMSKNETLDTIHLSLEKGRIFFKKTNRLIITLGTSSVFTHLESGKIVANCHKVPQQNFGKSFLNPNDIFTQFSDILKKIKSQNADLEVIMTLSPIRHLREGLVENQRSKAILLVAIAELCEKLDFVHYFPAYEIMMDELRDYRFYAQDMTHPTPQSLDFIWEKFQNAFFDSETKDLTNKIERIVKASEHRPFHTQSSDYQFFIKNQLNQIAVLEKENPSLDFSKEKVFFQSTAKL